MIFIFENFEMSKLNLKKFNLWTDTLNEENLCETIGTIDFSEEEPRKERGVESYKFESKARENTLTRSKFKRLRKKKNKKSPTSQEIGERLGPLVSFDESKPRSHIRVSEIDTDDAVVKEIARVLDEPKDDVIRNKKKIKNFFLIFYFLIERCVKILGKKKSLELLYATEDIENAGGMPTTVQLKYFIFYLEFKFFC